MKTAFLSLVFLSMWANFSWATGCGQVQAVQVVQPQLVQRVLTTQFVEVPNYVQTQVQVVNPGVQVVAPGVQVQVGRQVVRQVNQVQLQNVHAVQAVQLQAVQVQQVQKVRNQRQRSFSINRSVSR